MYSRIRIFTLLLMSAAWLVALGWLISTRDFEPALTAIALLATITTLYADHWLLEREKRHELLVAIVHELYVNLRVVADPVFGPTPSEPAIPKVFPRLAASAISHAIASGAFTTERDSELFRLLHSWQERADDLNQRLNLTEMCAFIVRDPAEIAAFRSKLSEGQVFRMAHDALRALSQHLLDHYSRESGITRETVLFAEKDRVA